MATPEDFLLQPLNAETQQAIAADNPYFTLQKAPDALTSLAIQSLKADPRHYPGQGVGAAALGGFISGLLGGAGQEHQQDLTNKYRKTVGSLIAGQPVGQDDSGLDPDLFNLADRQASMFKIAQTAKDEELTTRSNLEQRKAVFDAIAKATSQEEVDKIVKAAKMLGIIGEDFTVPKIGGGENKSDSSETSDSVENLGPKLPIKSIKDVEQSSFKENLAQGYPRTQAAASAEKTAEDLRARTKALFGAGAAAEADTIDNAEKIIRQGKEGMAKAGTTGSAIASTYEKARAWLGDTIPVLKSEEASTQAEGDKLLELTKNLGASLNRIKGSGALSDMESRALFATALSPNNVKEQNEAILRTYENGLAILKDHQAFMNYFQAQGGGSPEMAQTLWNIYKADNPIVVSDESGTYTINETRTPWQKYDFSKGYERFMSGEASTKPTGAVPSVGSTFNGAKVISVKQIK